MAIAKGHQANFDTMLKAAKNGNLALAECTDAKTGKPVITVCMMSRVGNEMQMTPVAKMFDGNPFHELMPPSI